MTDIEQYKVTEEPFYQPSANEIELYEAAYAAPAGEAAQAVHGADQMSL